MRLWMKFKRDIAVLTLAGLAACQFSDEDGREPDAPVPGSSDTDGPGPTSIPPGVPRPSDGYVAIPAATAVGATDGEFTVGQGGDASYSLRLALVKGTAEIEPELSLVYNSSGGDSPVGLGWSVGGQSVVTRCGNIIETDGFVDGPDFDQNDRFCLDGQRLVAIAGANGASGTEYRTEIDNFTRIYSYGQAPTGGPERFVAYLKNGQILHYGETGDSRLEVLRDGVLGPVSAWALNRVEDRLGNYMTYTYVDIQSTNQAGEAGSEHYLSRIDYTGNVDAGLIPFASVRFVYDGRPDVIAGYQHGASVLSKVRLTRIENYRGETEVRSYRLSYRQSTPAGRSQLAAVQECGSDGTCLAATTFSSATAMPGFASASNVVLPTGAAGPGLSNRSVEGRHETFADLDGDGDLDRAWIPHDQDRIYAALWQNGAFGPAALWLDGSASPAGPLYSDLGKHEAWLDINADGKTDRVWVPRGASDIYVALSTGTAFAAPQMWLQDQTNGVRSLSFAGTHEAYADIDGDGLIDRVWIPEGAAGQVRTYVALNTGTSFAPPFVLFPLHDGLPNYSLNGIYEDYVDLNGDGLTDYAWIPEGGSQLHATLANDDPQLAILRFDPPTVWSAEDTRVTPGSDGRVNFRTYEDVNGDGLLDLLFYRENAGCGEIRVAINTGARMRPSRVFASSCAGGVPLLSSDVRHNQFVDLNDDGRADHVWTPSDRSSVWVAYSTGSSFSAPVELVAATVGVPTRSISVTYFDVDGDGSVDRLWIPENTPSGSFYLLKGNRVSHLLTAIENGFGREILINYDTLSNPAIYTRESNAVFPVVDVGGAMAVVASTRISDGIGGYRERTYKYQGLKMHVQGLGNLGMSLTIEAEGAKPIATVRGFSQDYARRLQGMLHSGFTMHLRAGGTASDPFAVTNEFSNEFVVDVVQTPGGRIFQPRVSKVVTAERDLDATVLSRRVTENLTVDSYGNVTSMRSSVYDEEDKLIGRSVTSTQYDNDATIWSLGLPRRLEVTRSLPGETPAVPAITLVSEQQWNTTTRLLEEEVTEPGSPNLELRRSYEHDDFGNRIRTTTSAPGIATRTTSASFDRTGRLVRTQTNPLGHSLSNDYDALEYLKSTTDHDGLTTSYEYDGYGRTTVEMLPTGVATRTSYSACDESCPSRAVYYVSAVRDGGVPKFEYFDVLGRSIRVITGGVDDEWVIEDREYDTFGRVVRQSEPFFQGDSVYWTSAQHDALDRSVSVESPDGSVSTTEYEGNRVVYTNELLQTRTEVRNALGQLREVHDAQNNVLRYRYDALDQLIEMRDPADNVTTTTYDRRGRKLAMDDPDMGYWTYEYNNAGELVRQTDAKGQVTEFEYDVIGRVIHRLDASGEATAWTYDSASMGTGSLARVAQTDCSGLDFEECRDALNGAVDYEESYTYDELGRPYSVRVVIEGDVFEIFNTFDELGRVDSLTYPEGGGARLRLSYHYDGRGYLNEIRNADSGTRYWWLGGADARGNVTLGNFANGLATERTYDPQTGFLKRIMTDIHGQVSVQQLAYEFDPLGNLLSRRDELQNVSESARYDELNRLIGIDTITPSGITQNFASYNAIGNIVVRSDVGDYFYGDTCDGVKAGPHAVTSTGVHGGPNPVLYCYDANGSMIRSGDREIEYTAFGKPARFVQGSTETIFAYGPDRQHYQRADLTAEGATTTTYVGGLFERTEGQGVTLYRSMIGDFAVHTRTVPDEGTAVSTVHYLHRDHLGSIDAITDEEANVVERFSYDAWGKRRSPDWTPAGNASAFTSSITLRGFTGHEQIDPFGLIQMGGRVYDPRIGRFLSADPFVQAIDNLQSLNRYSYVLNNPLSYVDPSGFFSFKKFLKTVFDYTLGKKSFYGLVVRGVRSALRAVARVWAKVPGLEAVVAGVACTLGGPAGCLAFSAFSASVQLAAGASLGDVIVGTAIALVAARVSGAIINGLPGVDKLSKPLVAPFTAGVAGGITAEAQGGRFKDGFRAGVFNAHARQIAAGVLQQVTRALSYGAEPESRSGSEADEEFGGPSERQLRELLEATAEAVSLNNLLANNRAAIDDAVKDRDEAAALQQRVFRGATGLLAPDKKVQLADLAKELLTRTKPLLGALPGPGDAVNATGAGLFYWYFNIAERVRQFDQEIDSLYAERREFLRLQDAAEAEYRRAAAAVLRKRTVEIKVERDGATSYIRGYDTLP